MRRALVIRFSSLGDLILTLPSLEYLISTGVEVHVLTKESFLPLFEVFGKKVNVRLISNHATFLELVQKTLKLRQYQYDVVYDLHRNLRSFIVGLILRRPVRRVRKFRAKELVLYLFHGRIYRFLKLKAIDRRQAALNTVGAPTTFKGDQALLQHLPPPAETVQTWAQNFPRGYVCIARESAWQQKEWPIERFIEVARKLHKDGFGIVWVGLKKIPKEAIFSGSLDLTANLSLAQVAGVLKGAKLLFCNDSGLMHLSEAVGTPVMAVFGPTSLELGFAPRLEGSAIIQRDLWCRPCSKTGRWCIRPFHRWKCLDEVSVAQTYEVLQKSAISSKVPAGTALSTEDSRSST
ncbi:MAG: glycosyltransferase family 9 protein [Bdellovibrionota bacterium]